MPYEQKFLLSLLLTLAVEIPVVVLSIRYLFKQKEIAISKIIFSGIVASSLTLPYFWFVLPFYVSNWMTYVVVGEGLIILVEAFAYQQLLLFSFKKALVLSLLANTASIVVGWLAL